jgi:hypothetical protein
MKTIQLFLAILLLPVLSIGQIIVTVAGTPGSLPGHTGDGGPATNAVLGFPVGLAIDASNNVYFTSGFYIRKLTPAGIISTVAGNGGRTVSSVFDTGNGSPATAVPINGVDCGLFLDGKEDMYFGSTYSVRKVNRAGILNTVVGLGYLATSPSAGQPATAAALSGAYDVYIDSGGTLYYTDSGAYIRYVDGSGIVRNFAGDGRRYGVNDSTEGVPATATSVCSRAITGDRSGNIYIGCSYFYPGATFYGIRKVDKRGIITNYAGTTTYGHSGDGGPATAAKLDIFIGGMACDKAGNLYFSETFNACIRKITPAGIISTIAGIPDSEGYRGNGVLATTAKLQRPAQIKVAPNGDLYFADFMNNIVRRIMMNPAGVAQPYVPLATLTAYPNPTTQGQVTLRCSYPEAIPMDITISAADGRYTQQSHGNTNAPVNLQLPTSGVYYITAHLKDQSVTQTVVVQ